MISCTYHFTRWAAIDPLGIFESYFNIRWCKSRATSKRNWRKSFNLTSIVKYSSLISTSKIETSSYLVIFLITLNKPSVCSLVKLILRFISRANSWWCCSSWWSCCVVSLIDYSLWSRLFIIIIVFMKKLTVVCAFLLLLKLWG